MTVDDAGAALESKWDTDAATVGGMVIEALGHLPAPGEVVTIGHLEFEVERVAAHVIESLLVRQLARTSTEPEP
jgi:Mg2+/Co2+ transporter CorC